MQNAVPNRHHAVVKFGGTPRVHNPAFIELKCLPASVHAHGYGLLRHGFHEGRLAAGRDGLEPADLGGDYGCPFRVADSFLSGVRVRLAFGRDGLEPADLSGGYGCLFRVAGPFGITGILHQPYVSILSPMFSPRVLYQPKLPLRRFPVPHHRHGVVHLRRTLLAVHSAFIELKSHSRGVDCRRHRLIGHRLHELGLLESGDPLKSLEFGLDLGRLVFLAVPHFHGVWVIGFGGYATVEEDVEESGADPAAMAAQAYDVAV
nr:hypothetical protein Iba_chr12dCG0240 [Ipomoea batatas]